MLKIFFSLEPGGHYARGSRSQNPPRHQRQQPKAPRGSSRNRDRRTSLSQVSHVSGNHPHLPKSGAQKLAKQASRTDMHEEWMRTPDAGQSGYVFGSIPDLVIVLKDSK